MKRVLFYNLVIIIIMSAVFGCSGEVKEIEEPEIVKIFKALDAKDFDAQNIVSDKEESENLAREVYTESQLEKALKYLEEMRRNKVKLVHYNTEYKDIQIIEEKDNEAKLMVHAISTGVYYTTDIPETKLGPLNHESQYKVILKKVDNHWKISEVSYLNEVNNAEDKTD